MPRSGSNLYYNVSGNVRRPRVWGSAWGMVLWLGCAAAVFAGSSLPYTRTTERYEIFTDISEEFCTLAAQHMDAIYSEYRLRFPEYESDSKDRFTVKVFSKREDYEAIIPPKARVADGVFLPDQQLLATFAENRPQEGVLRILYHEGFHQFLDEYIGGDVPLWLNEGFAEYFSEANWEGSKFRLGQKPWQRLKVVQSAIEAGAHISLEKFFIRGGEEWHSTIHEDNTRAVLQYSQAWSIVHFLLHARSGQHRSRLFGYLRSTSEGRSRDRAFRKNFGSDIEAMERAWKQYVNSLAPDEVSRCRKDMQLVLGLANLFYDHPSQIRSLGTMAEDIFFNRNVRWEIEAPDGEKITSEDRERVEEMLTCPEDNGRFSTSYVLRKDAEAGQPEFYCLHHDGIVTKGYFVSRAGEWEARTEVIVRETLPDGLLDRLKRKARRRR